MAEGEDVRITGELQRLSKERVGDFGVDLSANESIHDSVCRDDEREEQRKWLCLRHELNPGLQAKESEFKPIDIGDLIAEAKSPKL